MRFQNIYDLCTLFYSGNYKEHILQRKEVNRKKEEIGFSRMPIKGELTNCVISLQSEPPKWANWSSGVMSRR